MSLIVQNIGYGYHYLSEIMFQQDHSEIHENETVMPSYQTIAASCAIAIVGLYAIKKLINAANRPTNNTHQPIKDTPELFWGELEKNQRSPLPVGPFIFMGQHITEDLLSIQKRIFSECKDMSDIFAKYIQTGDLKPKTIIDLGCGIGANSRPLVKQGVTVIGIENMECLLEIYRSKIKDEEKPLVSLQCADLTTLEKYSAEDNIADVVLAINVLPYLPISSWKSTMKKIVTSLKPGGYFFATLFVSRLCSKNPVVELQERLGAQHYSIRDLGLRLVQHSGLELVEYSLKNKMGCCEFVARKPIVDEKQPFFDDSLDCENLSPIEIDDIFCHLLGEKWTPSE